MPNKIKLVFIIVAVIAVFSVYKLAQYIHVVANLTPAFQESSPLPSPDDDPDHDGLNNQQEMIWGSDPFNPDSDGDGFKDGEEVKSGHNPLVPGPSDLINDANLTNQFSNLIVSGLYAGDLKPDSSNYNQAIADITNDVTDSSKYLFNNNKPQSLQTIPGNSENRKNYLTQVGPTIRQFQASLAQEYENVTSNLNIIGDKGFSDSSIQTFYSNQLSLNQTLKDKAAGMIIPKDFEAVHANLTSLIQKMSDIDKAIVSGGADPIKASVAFNSLFSVYQDYVDVLNNFLSEINAQHLNPELLSSQ